MPWIICRPRWKSKEAIVHLAGHSCRALMTWSLQKTIVFSPLISNLLPPLFPSTLSHVHVNHLPCLVLTYFIMLIKEQNFSSFQLVFTKRKSSIRISIIFVPFLPSAEPCFGWNRKKSPFGKNKDWLVLYLILFPILPPSEYSVL